MIKQMLFDNFPQLENDILYTKMIEHRDEEQFVDMMMNPNCFTYTRGTVKKTRKSAIQLIDRYYMDYRNGRYLYVGLFLKATHEFIGAVKIFNINEKEDRVEISYRLNEPHWHKGYAELACRLILKYLLKTIHVRHIYAVAMKDNKVSNHILNRSGFVLEKTLHQTNLWKDKGLIDLNIYHLVH